MPTPSSARASSLVPRVFTFALAASFVLSALFFFLFSWHWPLLGDCSLIHYIAFLIQRGWAPYRQLGDMNMPGSYLIELAAMHLFGMGDLAWRFFDFTLLAIASASFFLIARQEEPAASALNVPRGTSVSPGAATKASTQPAWLAGLFAASLFILIHGRDGITQAGQRDLIMAVCLIAATAFLFVAVRSIRARGTAFAAAVAFGLLSGIAVTIKPTSSPLTLLQLALALRAIRSVCAADDKRHSEPEAFLPARLILSTALAYLIAPAAALIFLLREHSLRAFLAGFRGIVPYYASLGHRPLSFVLLHSLSPLLPLVVLWLILLALRPARLPLLPNWERNALFFGVLFGILNCVVQQRALPYYRYPLLAFLLPLMALDFTRAFRSATPASAPVRTRIAQSIAILALAFAAFFLAPQSAVLIHRYRWQETDFISSLDRNLLLLGGPSLSGHIQCIDSISGCGNALYRLRLEPSTGVLSDFLLFGAVSDSQPPEAVPIVRDTRASFFAAMLASPPRVIVVSSHLHMDGPDNFAKLARWPAFASFLASRYTLVTEWSPTRTARWWSREETPASYRIYLLQPGRPGVLGSPSDGGAASLAASAHP